MVRIPLAFYWNQWWMGERTCSMQPSDYPLIGLPKMGWNRNKPQLFPRVICFLGVAYWWKCLGNWLPIHIIIMYLLQSKILVVSTKAGRQIVYNLLSCTHVAASHGVCLHCVYHTGCMHHIWPQTQTQPSFYDKPGGQVDDAGGRVQDYTTYVRWLYGTYGWSLFIPIHFYTFLYILFRLHFSI